MNPQSQSKAVHRGGWLVDGLKSSGAQFKTMYTFASGGEHEGGQLGLFTHREHAFQHRCSAIRTCMIELVGVKSSKLADLDTANGCISRLKEAMAGFLDLFREALFVGKRQLVLSCQYRVS